MMCIYTIYVLLINECMVLINIRINIDLLYRIQYNVHKLRSSSNCSGIVLKNPLSMD